MKMPIFCTDVKYENFNPFLIRFRLHVFPEAVLCLELLHILWFNYRSRKIPCGEFIGVTFIVSGC